MFFFDYRDYVQRGNGALILEKGDNYQRFGHFGIKSMNSRHQSFGHGFENIGPLGTTRWTMVYEC